MSLTGPQIPPLPPHVRLAMLEKTAKGLVRGDGDAIGIAIKGFEGKLAEAREHIPGARS